VLPIYYGPERQFHPSAKSVPMWKVVKTYPHSWDARSSLSTHAALITMDLHYPTVITVVPNVAKT
jgi:hypothetical protein